MEEITKVKEIAESFLEVIVTFATEMVSTMNSTVPQILDRIANIEGIPSILTTIINLIKGLFGMVPILKDTTLIEIIFGGGVIVLVIFMLVKFFAFLDE